MNTASNKPTMNVLFETEWLSMREVVHLPFVKEYHFSHEKSCAGKKVAVLPFAMNADGVMAFLLRLEQTPCWSYPEPDMSTITGSVELGYTPEETAVKELLEEAGYEAVEGQLISLGFCCGTKSNDTVFHLFAVNVSGMRPGPIKGDGTPLDTYATPVWIEDVSESPDPLAATMTLRLEKLLRLR